MISNIRLTQQPSFTKNQKPKGVRAKGVRFEKRCYEALVKMYPDWEVIHGQWFLYDTPEKKDNLCQTDIILLKKTGQTIKSAIVVECKLSVRPILAKEKLLSLYAPIVDQLYGVKSIPLQLCKHLKKGTKCVIGLPAIPTLTAYTVVHCSLI